MAAAPPDAPKDASPGIEISSSGFRFGLRFRLLYRNHIFISIAYFTAFLLMAGAGVHMISASSSHKRERVGSLKRPAIVIPLASAAALDAFVAGIGLAILFKPVGLWFLASRFL